MRSELRQRGAVSKEHPADQELTLLQKDEPGEQKFSERQVRLPVLPLREPLATQLQELLLVLQQEEDALHPVPQLAQPDARERLQDEPHLPGRALGLFPARWRASRQLAERRG